MCFGGYCVDGLRGMSMCEHAKMQMVPRDIRGARRRQRHELRQKHGHGDVEARDTQHPPDL